MKIISDICYVNSQNELRWLKARQVYEIPEVWAKLISQGGVGAEIIKIK